jgi:hypothetical protein
VFYVCGHYICKPCFHRLMRTELHSKTTVNGGTHSCPVCRTPILPEAGVWVAHTDGQGKTYFYNTKTGKRSYDRPPECARHWEGKKDELGRRFFFNKLTSEKTWSRPDGANVEIKELDG